MLLTAGSAPVFGISFSLGLTHFAVDIMALNLDIMPVVKQQRRSGIGRLFESVLYTTVGHSRDRTAIRAKPEDPIAAPPICRCIDKILPYACNL